MKKILNIIILVFAFVLLTGCEYTYKDELQKAIDTFDNSNYTLNSTIHQSYVYSYMGEVEESDLTFKTIVTREGKRTLLQQTYEGKYIYSYLEKTKDTYDAYSLQDDVWVYDGNFPASEVKIISSVIDFSKIEHDDFVEVEEGKWVPTSNKYNDLYKEFYLNLEEDGAEVIYSEASGFTLYVQNGELYKVEFTYSEKYKLNDATYEIKIEHEFVFSNIGSTDVAKPQM